MTWKRTSRIDGLISVLYLLSLNTVTTIRLSNCSCLIKSLLSVIIESKVNQLRIKTPIKKVRTSSKELTKSSTGLLTCQSTTVRNIWSAMKIDSLVLWRFQFKTLWSRARFLFTEFNFSDVMERSFGTESVNLPLSESVETFAIA